MYSAGVIVRGSLFACTISGNTAKYGGGICQGFEVHTEQLGSLTDTIVAGNKNSDGAASDLYDFDPNGDSFRGSYNLIGIGGESDLTNGSDGNLVGVANPGLAPLSDNGGPTLTMALLPGSPAIGRERSSAGSPRTSAALSSTRRPTSPLPACAADHHQ